MCVYAGFLEQLQEAAGQECGDSNDVNKANGEDERILFIVCVCVYILDWERMGGRGGRERE